MSATTSATMLHNSEVHLIESQSNGRTYRVTVALPLAYHAAPNAAWPFHNTPARWPTIYLADGDWHAGMVTDMVRSSAWCGNSSDAIIVAIGYPEGEDVQASFRTQFTRRDHDLTLAPVPEWEKEKGEQMGMPNPTGDASGFLRFLSEELVPHIESAYRSDSTQRIFVGHSFGGLFGIYALLTAPGLFATLVCGSPSLDWGGAPIFAVESDFAANNKRLPARLFVFVTDGDEGPDDHCFSDTVRFLAILKGRGHEGLAIEQRFFTGFTHCEVTGAGYSAGLVYALKKR